MNCTASSSPGVHLAPQRPGPSSALFRAQPSQEAGGTDAVAFPAPWSRTGAPVHGHTHNHCSVLHSAGSRAPGSAPVGVSCASQGEPHPASDEQGPPPSRSREAPGGGRGRGVAGRGSPAQKGLTASCFSKESPPRLLSVPGTEYVLRIAWCSPVPSRLPLR